MEFFKGTDLVNSSGNRQLANHVLKGKKFICLYFSAHWCPPCRQFTPILAQAYQGRKNTSSGEVIFVSSDRSLEDMLSYMREAHGNWPAVPYDSILRSTLGSRFGVRGIPALIVINLDGSVITEDGRTDIMSRGAQSFDIWESLAQGAIDTSIVDLLNENPPQVKKDAAEILLKLISNVIKDPQNIKYRSIKLSNKIIETKLLIANGAFEILFSLGFEEGTDTLILPLACSMTTLNAFKEKIEALLANIGPVKTEATTTVSTRPTTSTIAGGEPASSVQPSNAPKTSKERENGFFQKLLNEKNHVLRYEDDLAQAKALSLIPRADIESSAEKMFQEMKSKDPKVKDEIKRDLILSQLTDWFKNDFFSWMDSPNCLNCDQPTVSKGLFVPTEEEQRDGASTVEGYYCKGCRVDVRFPRYHMFPSKLLETRVGRCGEWANCFALICRAMDFDTRHVLDWSDHVWVEVWSEDKKRWLHVDPCENAIDKPLIYDLGWGKKLSYVIATSKDEIQDVTQRYVFDTEALKSRRNEVSESWLTSTLLSLTQESQKSYSDVQKQKLTERRLVELVELMSPKNADMNKSEFSGRQSGSVAWRSAREEMGDSGGGNVTWRLDDKDKELETFKLEYDIIKDRYIRHDDSIVPGWINGVKNVSNIFRKNERDWKMVYLARTEGSDNANVSWELDLSDSGFSVKSVELKVESVTYENGRIIWQLCGGNICLLPSPGILLKSEELAGSENLKLSASLSGGIGDVAWQHTQLFRSSTKSQKQPSKFSFVVHLQKNK